MCRIECRRLRNGLGMLCSFRDHLDTGHCRYMMGYSGSEFLGGYRITVLS